LTQNNNFDLAYIGIGKALFNQGKYEEAQEMLANAYEVDNYSLAFKEVRKQIISRWLLPMAVVVVAALFGLVWLLGKAKKKNK
jgi:tetratricopeptide (TPR) repeat protein